MISIKLFLLKTCYMSSIAVTKTKVMGLFNTVYTFDTQVVFFNTN